MSSIIAKNMMNMKSNGGKKNVASAVKKAPKKMNAAHPKNCKCSKCRDSDYA